MNGSFAAIESFAVVTVLGLGGLGLSGCTTSWPRLSFAVEQRLLRETTLDDLPSGKAEPGDSVVHVIHTGKDGGSCSGALIGPRHVLTAEHCMMRVDAHHELTTTEIVPGDVHVELGGGYLPWGRVGVREIHGCPGYTNDLEHDVAVLVLSRPVPAEVPALRVSFDVPREAGVYELAGFGTYEKPREIPETGWFVYSLTRHLHAGPVRQVRDGSLVVEVTGAPGDSGGPIFDTATGNIVAVVSRLARQDDPKNREPAVSGPRFMTCRKTIEEALAR